MKETELRQIIKEEIKNVLNDGYTFYADSGIGRHLYNIVDTYGGFKYGDIVNFGKHATKDDINNLKSVLKSKKGDKYIVDAVTKLIKKY